MLPEHLVPARFHITPEKEKPEAAGKNASLTQGKTTLSDFEADILIGVSRSGKSRNMLLEEHDRHIKERLFRAAKIEVFARLLNDLQAEGEIDAQTLSEIMAEKSEAINKEGNAIWLNLITRETSAPLFYKLEDE
ncbi:hypothetical protein O7047_21115 [Pseudenterobacter timonensis]|uniref:Uncharacterized protein n=1 Tax=Pseudenterobacter timonensis TaxID=1755099 RepID=A0AAE4IYX9_9ENTR|nr:hypothetical protein [Pseudenterobacter timonensis]MDR9892721.1 hypothetical protein [Pseudenterobacter timonensis]